MKRCVTDRADIGLLSYPEATKEVTVLPWRQEQMAIAASPYHPLAKDSEDRSEGSGWRGLYRIR